MAYKVKKQGKKWLIIKVDGNIIVGRSDTKAKALRSIGYREEAEAKKKTGNVWKPKKVL